MTKDNRRIMTWTLNAGTAEYENDIQKYHNKIKSIGLHEFGADPDGRIYDFRTLNFYFDLDGNHTGILFPEIMETHMLQYPKIEWYFQIVLFGWERVKPMLDNDVINSQGRLPQDQFVHDLNKVLDIYETTRNGGQPLDLTGVEMDIEASMTADTSSQGNDVNFIAFLQKVKDEVLIPRKLKMRLNSYAMWGNQNPYYYRFHNYTMFANSAGSDGKKLIDELQIMTYDFAWSGSAAGASTPLWWFRNVADWARNNFDTRHNSRALLTMDNVYFGAAGYGNRWGMHEQSEVTSGNIVTFRNLLGWVNGKYRHYHTEEDENGDTLFVYHDQPYVAQTAWQDPESLNEIMYPHVYDQFPPQYMEASRQDGGQRTAVTGQYNRLDYVTSNFKQQIPKWTNVHDIANIPTSASGKAFTTTPAEAGLDDSYQPHYDDLKVYDPNMNMESIDFRHAIKTVDGTDYPFVGFYTTDRIYIPNDAGTACVMEHVPEGLITYTVNVPEAGNYKVVALTSYDWFDRTVFGGEVNGQSYVYGDDLPDWYPFMVSGSHWANVGSFDLDAGENTITVDGSVTQQRTPIYGFVVCDDFDQNYSGGEITIPTYITPFKDRDGSDLPIPKDFALAVKTLRRDARPALLWDDEFRTYGEGSQISGSTYYGKIVRESTVWGGGDVLDTNSEGQLDCRSEYADIGYTGGYWEQDNYRLHWDTNNPNNGSSGQLVLSNQWSANLSIEATIEIVSGNTAGIRFYAQTEGTVGDGYIFRINLKENRYELVLEDSKAKTDEIVASQRIGNIGYEQSVNLSATLHEGKAVFYAGGVQVFVEGTNNPVDHNGSVNVNTGEVTLERTEGAVGIYANRCNMYCSHLGIGTTDRWEPMEKFEVEIDGVKQQFGEISRSGYEYDEYGYLIYSGLNEIDTRDEEQFFPEDAYEVSLDYEITVVDTKAWEGAKDIKITLTDAGVWSGELLVGDKEGMSVMWAGDSWSFLDVMNIAVSEYGAKGVGLWVMGQEDPQLFELVPDVYAKEK